MAPGRPSRFAGASVGLLLAFTVGLPASAGDSPSPVSFRASWSLSRAVAHSAAPLGDLPAHELGLSTFRLRRTADGMLAGQTARSARCSEVTDSLAGSGFPTGYCTLLFENGHRLFLRYRGEYRATDSDGPRQEVTGSGEWELVGGTGIFSETTGSGTWQAKGTWSDGGVRTTWTMGTSGTIEGGTAP